MYKIEAVIRSQRLDAVQEALYEIDVAGLTTTAVRGTGWHNEPNHGSCGLAQLTAELPYRLKIEVVVTDEAYEEALEALIAAAQTGEVGDGKVFVTKLQDAIRIRTGERGVVAIE